MEIRWSIDALQDLNKIYQQLRDKNQKAAQKICAQIFSDADILGKHPMAGKREPYLTERKYPYRSLVTKVNNYKLVYFIVDNYIHIIAVWDCRRNPKQMAKDIK